MNSSPVMEPDAPDLVFQLDNVQGGRCSLLRQMEMPPEQNVDLSLHFFVSPLPSPSALQFHVPSLGFRFELSSLVDKDASQICTSTSSKTPHRKSGRLEGGRFFTLG